MIRGAEHDTLLRRIYKTDVLYCFGLSGDMRTDSDWPISNQSLSYKHGGLVLNLEYWLF